MRKYINTRVLIVLLLIIVKNVSAQDLGLQFNYSQDSQKYTLASPEVSSFEKYSLNPANHYVGKVDTSIPIYTIKAGNIIYPLSLVYNVGGIKVDQIASDVGLGWNLTSAILTRTINQANDFDNAGSLTLQPDYNTYSNDDKTNDPLIPGPYLKDNLPKIGYFLQKQINQGVDPIKAVDFLPDTYNFYANGFSTHFFFNDVNTPIEIIPNGTKIVAIPSKVRINTYKYVYSPQLNAVVPQYDLLTQDFFTIVITTNEGIEYTFSDCDYAINQSGTNNSKIDSPAQISAWHITKILDLKTNKKIDFIYDITSTNPINPAGTPSPYNVSGAQYSYLNSFNVGYILPIDSSYDLSATATARVDIQKKRLKKIVFDEGELDFNYNNIGESGLTTITRSDLPNGGDCVTQIYLKDKNLNTIKLFNFNYNYFTSDYISGDFNPDQSTSNNTYRYKRLKLVQFGEIGKPQYKFTYDETAKLPAINSRSFDFAGYYNNSSVIANVTNAFPTVYYYENKFENSLLPFPIPGITPNNVIQGTLDRQANGYAKTWGLTKITNPLGGYTEYSYEPNQFELFGQNITGGGVRIAQQKINDGKGTTRIINYSYQKDAVTTSGKIASMPFFGFPKSGYFGCPVLSYSIDEQNPVSLAITDPRDCETQSINWEIYDRSNLNNEITTGSYVGYSKVTETEVGKGRRELYYTSSSLSGFENIIYRTPPKNLGAQYSQIFPYDLIYPRIIDPTSQYYDARIQFVSDLAVTNSGIFSNIFTDNSYKRGKLLEEKVFNESNQLLKKTTLTYSDNLINTFTYHQGYTHLVDSDKTPYFVSIPGCTSTTPCQAFDSGHYVVDNSIGFVVARKDFKIAQYLPISETVSVYDTNGNNNDVASIYNYNQNGFLNSVQTATSDGGFIKNQYYYPQDSQMATEAFITDLITKNIIGIPLKTESYRNNEKLSEQKIVYAKDATTNNLLLQKFIYSKKGTDINSTLEKKITFNQYDDKGNILQYTLENGTSVSVIWGYNQTLPIAKIENATNVQISTALSVANLSVLNETNLTAINNLRTNINFSDSRITTYTYIPLIGVSTITDPKGDKITYTYDFLGRLQNVKDKNGNILSENEYHYKN